MIRPRRRWIVGALAACAACAAVAARVGAQVQGEVRGQLTDASTARPVERARVEISGRADIVTSGSDGSFVIRGLEPRAYTLRIRALGYLVHEADVNVVNARTTTVALALQPGPLPLRAVVVRTTRDTTTPGAVTFDRNAIEASGRRDVGELLQDAAGIVVTQAGGAGAATHVSIQGSGSNEVLVLLDGVPLNSVITGTADLSRVTLETVERITVLTGAQSARYGARALGGVIDIRTRRAEHELSVVTRAGAWGERNAALSLGDSRTFGAYRVGASLTGDYRTLDGSFPYEVPALRGGGTATRVNSDVTSRQLSGAWSLGNNAAEIRVRGEWEGMDRGVAGTIVQQSLTGRETNMRTAGGADLRWQQGRVLWTADGELTRERAAFADPAPPFGGTYDDVVDATSLTLSTSATIDVGAATLSLGGEARTLKVESTMLAANAPNEQRLVGAWGSVRLVHLALPGNSEFAAEASGRLDRDPLLGRDNLSPRFGVTLSHGAFVATGAVGSAYAPPSLADQFFHEGVLVRPNPGLQPERVHRDLSVRVAMHDVDAGPLTVRGSAGAYGADIDGMILWLPDFRYVWSPSNFDVRRSGWDLQGRIAAAAIGVDVQGTLSGSDVAYSGPVLTGQVAYRPGTSGGVVAGIASHGIRLEIGNRYVGARRTVPGSPLNVLAPYWLTDAKVTVPFTRDGWAFTMTAGLENAFDQRASMLVDYPYPTRTWTLALRVRRDDGRRHP